MTVSNQIPEPLSIIGGMAKKIQNNLTSELHDQFSWKIRFPKNLPIEYEVVEDEYGEEDVRILNPTTMAVINSDNLRTRCRFYVNVDENSVWLLPEKQYELGKDYVFIATYYDSKNQKKEICLAFTLSDEHTMRTFDTKTSIEILSAITSGRK